MSDPFAYITDRGIWRPLTLDGENIVYAPDSLNVHTDFQTTRVATADGTSRSFTRWTLDGMPDRVGAMTFSLPFSGIRDDTLEQMATAMARGGYRRFAYWKQLRMIYTAMAGQTQFFLPKRRLNAGQMYAGLTYEGIAIGTDTAPFRIWVNGTEIDQSDISYENGPSLTTPGAGESAVARDPNSDGYAQFLLGTACDAGDEVMTEAHYAFLVEMTEATIDYPQTIDESHSYVFTER